MVDRDLVRRRLALLDTYLEQLAPYRGIDRSAYDHDWRTQRIVERTLHLAIETCMDVADHTSLTGASAFRRQAPSRSRFWLQRSSSPGNSEERWP